MTGKLILAAFAALAVTGCLVSGAPPKPEVRPVVVTITGTATGEDEGVFGVSDLNGKPFTLSFSFDDAGAQVGGSVRCPGSSAVASGSAPVSHATAILTIGNASYAFGARANSKWRVARYLKSNCGNDGRFTLHIEESMGGVLSGIDLRVSPKRFAEPVITSLDWHSTLKNAKDIDQSPSDCNFLIADPHNSSRHAKGNLLVKTVKVR